MKHYTVMLADGRKLVCSEAGAAQGPVVLYLHGNPGSRHEVLNPAYVSAFKREGLRVISMDRPGYGESCPPPQRNHASLCRDVEQLLDHVGVSDCTVVGYSRGALPALALAAGLPDRIVAAGLLGATGMPDDPRLLKDKAAAARFMLGLVKHAPAVARGIMRANHFLDTVSPATRASRLKAGVPSRYDRQQLDREGEQLMQAHHQGLAANPAWVIEDWRNWLVYPLGFSLDEVQCPVYMWSGEDDRTCPVSNARRLSQRLCNLQEFKTVARMGHLHTPDVLVALMNRVAGAEPTQVMAQVMAQAMAHPMTKPEGHATNHAAAQS